MHFTLRQIEVFLAIAHYENVSRAAEHLAMSQSACSGALKDLERQYNVPLFDRWGKRLQLSDMGCSLRPKAEALLEQAKSFEGDLRRRKDMGLLKLGATLTIGNYLAVVMIKEFMLKSPGAKVSLHVANTQAVVQGLLNYDYDLGLIEGDINHRDLLLLPWRDDELVCFVAPDHPLAQHKQLLDSDLTSAAWILREQGSGTRQAFDRAMQGLLPQLNIVLELEHTEAIKRAVEAGMGISCLSRISLADAFARGSLVPLAVPHRDFSRRLYVALHKHKYSSPSVLQWLQLCGLASASVVEKSP
ncbi:MAG TPA: LysR substrate-binding domain-containing protein [Cellvibrionaceae bacterium]